jgi:hypothetical protein
MLEEKRIDNMKENPREEIEQLIQKEENCARDVYTLGEFKIFFPTGNL